MAMLMFFPFHDQCGDLLSLTISRLSVFREGGAGNTLDENFLLSDFLLPWSTLHSTLPWNERLTHSPVLFSATAPMDWLGLVVLVDSVLFTWPCTDESVCPSGYQPSSTASLPYGTDTPFHSPFLLYPCLYCSNLVDEHGTLSLTSVQVTRFMTEMAFLPCPFWRPKGGVGNH